MDETADLTLVVAPAGCGKTTLLAQYAACGPTVAWHRAEPGDRSVERFAAGLRSAMTSAGARGPELPKVVDGRLVDVLGCAGLDGSPLPVLIVDDFHAVVDTPAEAAFEAFLNQRPATLRVIVASRRMPSFNLSCAELGTVALLTADDLRFRSWEVEKLFGDVYCEPLPPSDAAALARRTAGWAASLHLFHLSTRGRRLDERREAITALTGRSRYARSYLARTVLDDLPADLRDFLRRTCVFEVMTADRCDSLLESTDSQRHLEELERRQALTTSDDDGRTFRYHEVLRRHLQSALTEDLGPARVRAWYTGAATLLEAEGALPEALRAYALAERWQETARLLRTGGAAIVESGPGTPWPEVFPAKFIDEDPWLSLAVARRLALDGRLAEASRRYRQAESLFADRRDREIGVRERRLVEAWSGGPAPSPAHWLDVLRTAVHRQPLLARRAQEPGGADEALGRGLVLMVAGDLDSAARVLGDLTVAPADSFTAFAARLAATVAIAATSPPDRGNLPNSLEHLAADAEEAGYTWIARQCRALEPLVSPWTLDDRRPQGAARVVDECDRIGDRWGALLAAAADALAKLLARRPSTADWDDVARRCRDLDAGSFEAWAVAFAAFAACADAAPEGTARARAAHRLARSAGVPGAEALAARAGRRDPAPPGMSWLVRLTEALAAAEDSDAESPRTGLILISPRRSRPPMTLHCLGGFRLELAGRDLDWAALRPRAATTLRFLAMHAGRPVHRETLLDALWPGLCSAQATRNLQVAVSSLRRFLEPDAPRGAAQIVIRTGDAYALVPPAQSDVDVATFQAAVREAHQSRAAGDLEGERAGLARAVGAYRGDLLPQDGPAEWVVADRERTRAQAAAAAGDLAALEATAGNARLAVAAARRSLELDPFRDASWRALLAAYALAGEAAAAERARREYTAVLETLGVTIAAVPSRSGGGHGVEP